MNRIFTLLSAALVAVIAVSCTCTPKKALLPTISGKAGEVVVVINKTDWEGSIGQELRDLLASDCPFLPQKEPLYTLVDIAPSAFTNIFQIHRNILLVNIGKEITELGVVYRHDVWAQPQCVIGVNAPDSETALQLIKDSRSMILNTIEQAERDRIITNATKYEERSIAPVVTEFIGGSPHFPTGYVIKKRTSSFIWIAYETNYVNRGFFVYKHPALGNEDDFKIENIVAKRNEVLRENVPGMFENTYMTTSDITVPGLEFIKYKGREFAQVRGYWEVENDYMGGPFISHTFYSKDGSELIVLEGFVYAPRYDKRHYMREAESLLYSFEWASDAKE